MKVTITIEVPSDDEKLTIEVDRFSAAVKRRVRMFDLSLIRPIDAAQAAGVLSDVEATAKRNAAIKVVEIGRCISTLAMMKPFTNPLQFIIDDTAHDLRVSCARAGRGGASSTTDEPLCEPEARLCDEGALDLSTHGFETERERYLKDWVDRLLAESIEMKKEIADLTDRVRAEKLRGRGPDQWAELKQLFESEKKEVRRLRAVLNRVEARAEAERVQATLPELGLEAAGEADDAK